MDIADFIIALVCGAIGGGIAGAVLKDQSFGALGNCVIGILGGGIGGLALVDLGTRAGGVALEPGSWFSVVASGGVGGAILMIIIGLIVSAATRA